MSFCVTLKAFINECRSYVNVNLNIHDPEAPRDIIQAEEETKPAAKVQEWKDAERKETKPGTHLMFRAI